VKARHGNPQRQILEIASTTDEQAVATIVLVRMSMLYDLMLHTSMSSSSLYYCNDVPVHVLDDTKRRYSRVSRAALDKLPTVRNHCTVPYAIPVQNDMKHVYTLC
jgi:hypothetical protein